MSGPLDFFTNKEATASKKDLIVRRRAAGAKRRWPGGGEGGGGGGGKSTGQAVTLVADPDTLVLEKETGGDEYKVEYAEVEGDKATLIAPRKGKAMDPAPTFHRP